MPVARHLIAAVVLVAALALPAAASAAPSTPPIAVTIKTTGGVAFPTGIPAESYSWGVTNAVMAGTTTGGASVGKPKQGELVITRRIDKSSPLLFNALARGRQIDSLLLTFSNDIGGDGPPVAMASYKLENVLVSGIKHTGDVEDIGQEQVTFAYGKASMATYDYSNAGALVRGYLAVMDFTRNLPAYTTIAAVLT